MLLQSVSLSVFCFASVMASSATPSEHNLYPPQTPLDANAYPVAPDELSLQQVHVYVRHGERTPVRVRMDDAPASIPAHWTLCRTARHFRSTVATFGDAVQDAPRSADGVEFLPVKRVVERADGTVQDGEWYVIALRYAHHFF